MMIKTFLAIIFMSFMTVITAEEQRYESYQLKPRYNFNNTEQSAVLIERRLKVWQKIKTIQEITVDENTLVAYQVELDKNNAKPYLDYSEPFVLKGIPFERSDYQAISIIKRNKVTHVLKKDYDLFPVSHYGHDYYGCIGSKPVFAAPLIEGKPDMFFAVTGRGYGTDQSVFDNHKLSIVGLKGTEVAVSEYLFIGNYYVPPHAIDEKNTYTYNYPAAGKDRLKDGMLNNQDGRGRKKYAKLFVADFDKNNKLELVFWHRQYQSTRTKGKKVGMVFEKEWFTAYEENNTADGFNKKILTIQQGHTLLKEANLGWKQGYPKDNHLCTGRLKRLPMMPLIYDSDEIAY